MITAAQAQLEILTDSEALARRVADWLLAAATAKDDGVFSVSVSGGTTPRTLYERLAAPPYRDSFPWDRTHWFWGDERFVPHDDPRSNYRMVREALLSRVPIPATHIHAVPTTGVSPEAAASEYECDLQSFYGAKQLDPARPLFDVTLLGLGPDGHTASLFPGTAVLAERERWVAAVVGAKSEARITLTYPALESSRSVAFLVAGEGSARFSPGFAGAMTPCRRGVCIRPVRSTSLLMQLRLRLRRRLHERPKDGSQRARPYAGCRALDDS